MQNLKRANSSTFHSGLPFIPIPILERSMDQLIMQNNLIS